MPSGRKAPRSKAARLKAARAAGRTAVQHQEPHATASQRPLQNATLASRMLPRFSWLGGILPTATARSTTGSPAIPLRILNPGSDSTPASHDIDVEANTAGAIPPRPPRWRAMRNLLFWASMSTILGFVVNVALIRPAFESIQLAREALAISQWTAIKDFTQDCRNNKVRAFLHYRIVCLVH
jgi:hypothetical protein